MSAIKWDVITFSLLNQYIPSCNQTARFFTFLFLYRQYFWMLLWCSMITEIEIYTYPLFGDSHVMFGALVQNDAMLWFSLHLYISQALLSAFIKWPFCRCQNLQSRTTQFCNKWQYALSQDAQFEAQFWIKIETN